MTTWLHSFWWGWGASHAHCTGISAFIIWGVLLMNVRWDSIYIPLLLPLPWHPGWRVWMWTTYDRCEKGRRQNMWNRTLNSVLPVVRHAHASFALLTVCSHFFFSPFIVWICIYLDSVWHNEINETQNTFQRLGFNVVSPWTLLLWHWWYFSSTRSCQHLIYCR